jgi:universal stress protein E
MYAIHHILVAIKDPRAKSQATLAKAAVLAAALDAPLRLFHAIDVPVYPDLGDLDGAPVPQFQRQQHDAQLRALEEIAAPLRRRGINVSTAVEWDFPRHEAIIRAAAHFGASLIVAGDNASAHHLPWLLRYADWELIRSSPVPVLLIKSPRPYRKPVILAALDPKQSFNKPAALDSEILRFSATLAQALKGVVHAVHGYVPVPSNLAPEILATPGELEKRLAAAEAAAFGALAKAAEPLGVSRACLHVEGRHPVDAVLETATETGSQIVALGSLSRSGVDRLLIGNTAEKLIDRLHCDVLVVKPPSFAHTAARAPRGPRRAPLPMPMASM